MNDLSGKNSSSSRNRNVWLYCDVKNDMASVIYSRWQIERFFKKEESSANDDDFKNYYFCFPIDVI